MQKRLIQLTLFVWLVCLAATAATDEFGEAVPAQSPGSDLPS